MASLVEVFSELFRSLGYATALRIEAEGTTGRRHAVALQLEKDSRRLAVACWLHRQPLGPHYLTEFLDTVRDTGMDGGLIVCLGATPEPLVRQAAAHRVQVWDSRRVAQELGHAVLHETCPEAWGAQDPLTPPRASRILDQLNQTSLVEPPAAIATAPPSEPAAEPPFPAEIPTLEASPQAQPTEVLQVPAAFGILDQALAPAPPTVAAPEPAPIPAAPAAVAATAPAAPRPGRNLLRLQVSKDLAASLARSKTRTVEHAFLRLVPHHVFDYEATVLIEGNLDGETRRGRIAVDAAQKRAHPWTQPLDLTERLPEGAEVDEKPVRLAQEEAAKLVVKELKTLVTRDVVMEEDASEWKVVVKKKVTLGEDELRLHYLGVFWQPLWRITGRDGSIEIDATSGQVSFEESLVPRSDSQLI